MLLNKEWYWLIYSPSLQITWIYLLLCRRRSSMEVHNNDKSKA